MPPNPESIAPLSPGARKRKADQELLDEENAQKERRLQKQDKHIRDVRIGIILARKAFIDGDLSEEQRYDLQFQAGKLLEPINADSAADIAVQAQARMALADLERVTGLAMQKRLYQQAMEQMTADVRRTLTLPEYLRFDIFQKRALARLNAVYKQPLPTLKPSPSDKATADAQTKQTKAVAAAAKANNDLALKKTAKDAADKAVTDCEQKIQDARAAKDNTAKARKAAEGHVKAAEKAFAKADQEDQNAEHTLQSSILCRTTTVKAQGDADKEFAAAEKKAHKLNEEKVQADEAVRQLGLRLAQEKSDEQNAEKEQAKKEKAEKAKQEQEKKDKIKADQEKAQKKEDDRLKKIEQAKPDKRIKKEGGKANNGKVTFQYMSDLHLEHVPLQYNDLTISATADYLLLGGDIGRVGNLGGHGTLLRDFLSRQCARFKLVFWVLGNNEFKNGSQSRTYRQGLHSARRIAEDPGMGRKLILLQQKSHELTDARTGGVITILGCCLWSDTSRSVGTGNQDGQMDNTFAINAARHKADLAWLRQQVAEIRSKDENRRILIMTHHAPGLPRNCSKLEHWRTSPNEIRDGNLQYCTNIIDAGPPAGSGVPGLGDGDVWMYGHTHHTTQFFGLKNVKVIANQAGRDNTASLGTPRSMLGVKGVHDFDITRTLTM